MTDWMILVPPVSFVFEGTSGFCGSLDQAVTIPVPPALLSLLLLEPESLLLEQAVSKRAAAAAAARPRPMRVDTVMLRLLKILDSPEPGWCRFCALPGQTTGARRSIGSSRRLRRGATAGTARTTSGPHSMSTPDTESGACSQGRVDPRHVRGRASTDVIHL